MGRRAILYLTPPEQMIVGALIEGLQDVEISTDLVVKRVGLRNGRLEDLINSLRLLDLGVETPEEFFSSTVEKLCQANIFNQVAPRPDTAVVGVLQYRFDQGGDVLIIPIEERITKEVTLTAMALIESTRLFTSNAEVLNDYLRNTLKIPKSLLDQWRMRFTTIWKLFLRVPEGENNVWLRAAGNFEPFDFVNNQEVEDMTPTPEVTEVTSELLIEKLQAVRELRQEQISQQSDELVVAETDMAGAQADLTEAIQAGDVVDPTAYNEARSRVAEIKTAMQSNELVMAYDAVLADLANVGDVPVTEPEEGGAAASGNDDSGAGDEGDDDAGEPSGYNLSEVVQSENFAAASNALKVAIIGHLQYGDQAWSAIQMAEVFSLRLPEIDAKKVSSAVNAAKDKFLVTTRPPTDEERKALHLSRQVRYMYMVTKKGRAEIRKVLK
jgi:hypothetical protein